MELYYTHPIVVIVFLAIVGGAFLLFTLVFLVISLLPSAEVEAFCVRYLGRWSSFGARGAKAAVKK
jgi:hypothetical protein